MSASGHQFIGPLRPGQKPPNLTTININESWSIFDILTNHNAADEQQGGTSSSTNDHVSSSGSRIGKTKKQKKFIRAAGGTTWEDPTLAEWDPDDYRVFCGDLGNDVTDELLTSTFEKYPSFVKARVIRDKRTAKSKGYGFISFKDAGDYAKAIKEWDGKYLGCRPIKLRKSVWRDRQLKSSH